MKLLEQADKLNEAISQIKAHKLWQGDKCLAIKPDITGQVMISVEGNAIFLTIPQLKSLVDFSKSILELEAEWK